MRVLTLLCALLALLAGAFAQGSSDQRQQADRARLASLGKEYKTLRAAHTRKPDPNTRQRFVRATVEYGTAVMMSPSLTPNVKYPKALRLYREALRLDPKNKEAAQNKKMIEDIYVSMGRPIPK
jgi:tetratricopeptide (TPR) repeat protein